MKWHRIQGLLGLALILFLIGAGLHWHYYKTLAVMAAWTVGGGLIWIALFKFWPPKPLPPPPVPWRPPWHDPGPEDWP